MAYAPDYGYAPGYASGYAAPQQYSQPAYAAPQAYPQQYSQQQYPQQYPQQQYPQEYSQQGGGNAYFCASSNAYYPQARQCPEGWQQIDAQPGR